jgi:hypothetical protein
MANPRLSKRHLEKARQERAASKRERKRERAEAETPASAEDETSQEALLEELAQLHKQYADEVIGFDEFDERKNELTARLRVD